MERPAFSRELSATEFGRWYWLKSELVEACRLLRVSPTGSKPELTARIVAALSGTALPGVAPQRISGAMPTGLTLDTRIGKLQVIDGGLATELSRQGMDLSDDLWSARVLLEAPDAIEQVHAEYYRAGADIAITSSYQASYEGFAARGLDAEATTAVLRRSVALAQSARRRVLREQPEMTRALLVAASVGPYGAVLHDGSEYRGDYALGEAALVDFHRERFAVLADAGADLLACETIPSRTEAAALVRLLSERADAKAWITFSCRDGRHTAAGDEIAECARWLDGVPQVVGIGVNCVAPEWVESLIGEIKTGTDKPIVVYANSGETWDAEARCWRGEADRFTTYVSRWLDAGARWIGGCCRTTPEDIRKVRAEVDAFSERSGRR